MLDFDVTTGNTLSLVDSECFALSQTEYEPRNKTDDLISSQLVSAIGDAINGTLFPVLFLVSVPTNVINMAVFCKQGLRERINLCLFARALFDLLYMTACYVIFANHLLRLRADVTNDVAYIQFLLESKLSVLVGVTWVSAFVTTLIACERCLCVISPLHSRTILKTKTMAVIIACSFVAILGCFYVVILKWSSVCVFNTETNTTVLIEIPSTHYAENRLLVDTFEETIFGLALPGFCITVVSVTTIATTLRLRKLAVWRQSSTYISTSLSRRDIALTRTLIGVCIVFIACYSTSFIVYNAKYVFPEVRFDGRLCNTARVLRDVNLLLKHLNASYSFFVYYSTGMKYRKTLRDMCLRIPCLKDLRTRVQASSSSFSKAADSAG